jgi:hypothetical protein
MGFGRRFPIIIEQGGLEGHSIDNHSYIGITLLLQHAGITGYMQFVNAIYPSSIPPLYSALPSRKVKIHSLVGCSWLPSADKSEHWEEHRMWK